MCPKLVTIRIRFSEDSNLRYPQQKNRQLPVDPAMSQNTNVFSRLGRGSGMSAG